MVGGNAGFLARQRYLPGKLFNQFSGKRRNISRNF